MALELKEKRGESRGRRRERKNCCKKSDRQAKTEERERGGGRHGRLAGCQGPGECHRCAPTSEWIGTPYTLTYSVHTGSSSSHLAKDTTYSGPPRHTTQFIGTLDDSHKDDR